MAKAGDIEAKTRFEAVLLQMRELILSGQLRPGARVQEIAVGEMLGVSRTPVRLSLTVLEQEGLVRGEPNRGFTVRAFTTTDVLAAYDVRAALEGLACRLLGQVGLGDDHIRALDACLDQGASVLAGGFFDASRVRGWAEANARFHDLIVGSSGNASLKSAFDIVNRHPLAAPVAIAFRTANLERLYATMREAQDEHVAVVAALKRREFVRAEHLMAEHVLRSRDVLAREMAGPGPGLPEFVKRLLTSVE